MFLSIYIAIWHERDTGFIAQEVTEQKPLRCLAVPEIVMPSRRPRIRFWQSRKGIAVDADEIRSFVRRRLGGFKTQKEYASCPHRRKTAPENYQAQTPHHARNATTNAEAESPPSRGT
jgi:hypothetical protein